MSTVSTNDYIKITGSFPLNPKKGKHKRKNSVRKKNSIDSGENIVKKEFVFSVTELTVISVHHNHRNK